MSKEEKSRTAHEMVLMLEDLAMLVRALVRKLPDDDTNKKKALEYLKRKRLMGSPLRKEN